MDLRLVNFLRNLGRENVETDNQYASSILNYCTVAASSWWPINVKSPNVDREKRVGVVAQKNTHHASKYFLVWAKKEQHHCYLYLYWLKIFLSKNKNGRKIHTDKCFTSEDLVCINQSEKRSSQPHILRVRICASSSPVLLILFKSNANAIDYWET